MISLSDNILQAGNPNGQVNAMAMAVFPGAVTRREIPIAVGIPHKILITSP
jgi:hypothetical protein